MRGSQTAVAEPMTEARERMNIVSFLQDLRGNVQPNKQMLIEGMSAVMTHELGGLQLYRTYSEQTKNQHLKEKWREFGEETQVHANVAERVISALGGDPARKGQVAKELEKVARIMLNIEAQGEAADLVRLGYLLQAEIICRHHWKGVNNLARRIKDPALAKIFWDASRIVERDEEEHVNWHSTMFDSQMEKVVAGI